MSEFVRFAHHFEPRSGWMNDPNGLIFYKGRYHAFFQHNPYEPVWGPMHWGHAVSDDLIHWEELPIALRPDMPYEDDGGCFSGSAIEKDGKLYLFYTSVSHGLKQTQSVAVSEDGIHFEKCAGNPVIPKNPLGYPDFRDPKVTEIDGAYYMVTGTGNEDGGKVLLFTSEDLLNWEYLGVLFQGAEYGPCIECPDFFKMGEKYVLMFSKMGEKQRATHFVIGDFADGKLVNYAISRPEVGPDFYAPQTFSDGNRRILIGWMYNWQKKAPEGCPFAGALTIPRELTLTQDGIKSFPVREASLLLAQESEFVSVTEEGVVITDLAGREHAFPAEDLFKIDILQDTKSVEVFLNGGESVVTQWLI